MTNHPPGEHLLDAPHHDGSEQYVGEATPALGDAVPIRLRVPGQGRERAVWVRAVVDGEPRRIEARLDRADDAGRWYVAELPIHNPVTAYRWLLDEPGGYRWVNGTGAHAREVIDAADFRLTTYAPPPGWTAEAVVYQIFPDRFARSPQADERPLPDWAEPTAWDTPPDGRSAATPHQFYGGDLGGIEANLDHIERLGANTLYLTPFFPGRSNHRYDASTFNAVDPLLGGDAALASLTAAAHRRRMRVIGDITTHHTGSAHEWFRAASADPNCPERGFYHWLDQPNRIDREPYATWLGVETLPKLNWDAPKLWERMIDGPDSVIGRWMREPYLLDGWRVDVANMTGRYGRDDHAREVARRLRATVLAANPQGLTVSEHFHDAADDVMGDGWMSNMNYSAFTRPLWTWVVEPDCPLDFLGIPAPIPRRGAPSMVASMREFTARYPWKVATRLWNMLGSHDTPRIRTVTGSAPLAEVATAALLTMPGTPALFMGDEGGFTGDVGEAGRRTMPWEQIGQGGGSGWQGDVFDSWRSLIAARQGSRALREGGLRWAFIQDDAIGFLRETAKERVLVVLARAPWAGMRLPLTGAPELLAGGTLCGTPTLHMTGQALTISGDGPAIGIWRLG
ncbi:MAG: alpha-amylase family glycosyl hydrolase [Promicromonosporaceae bacterium]|nr:alpha-amylase family glycosyl hydrolase [Promicromonosporaceae bacterium]